MPFKNNQTKVTHLQPLLTVGCLMILSTLAYTIYGVVKHTGKNSQRSECYNSSQLKLDSNNVGIINGRTEEKTTCFYFYASFNQLLDLDSNTKIRVITPKGQSFLTQGKFKEYLKDDGEYLIRFDADISPKFYSVNISLKNIKKENNQESFVSQEKSNLLSYNSKEDPNINNKLETQEIVNSAVNLAKDQGFPIDKLSVSLISLNDNSYGEYQEQIPRFPASLSKLFWLIALFGQYDADKKNQGGILEEDLRKMIQDSDNNTASRVLDKLTNTNSGDFLSSDEFEKWSTQRRTINHYFERSGYKNINISQKNFPIPDLKLTEPSGRDKQMRGDTLNPTRNFITSYSAARILLDIERESNISFIQSICKIFNEARFCSRKSKTV